MLREVTRFVLDACERLHIPLSLNFYPSCYQNGKFDIYSIHFRGRSLINVTNKNFYDIPKAKRFHEFVPLLKVGMNENLGEYSTKDQIEIPRRPGINVIRDGKLLFAV